jgi:ATP-dependent RNA helicase DDX35
MSVQSLFNFSGENKTPADNARKKFCVYEGDHLTLLNVFNTFLRYNLSPEFCQKNFISYKALMRAVEIRSQLRKYLKKFKVPVVSCPKDKSHNILKCLLSGYFSHVAKLQADGTYATIRGNQIVNIHPTSVLYNRNIEWVMYHEVVQTTGVFMREVSAIDPLWCMEIAPHFFEFKAASVKHQESLQKIEDSLRSVF